MGNNRRNFIKGSLLGGAALASGTLANSATAHGQQESRKAMDILVLGGTGFIGPHMVRTALQRGHSVTLFNRGLTNDELFPDLETINGDRGGDLSVLKGRKWDAVIDNSGYVPRHVQNSTATLAANIDQYLYISSISVYDSFEIANDEGSNLATIDDETIEDVTAETYGALKALCEKHAQAEISADKLTILRPTYICGPGDRTDRFSYWPVRVAKGGEMLWPGGPEHPLQIIDVRDLADFTIDCLEQKIAGIYNTVTPADSYSMGQMLADSESLTSATVDEVWVDELFAIEAAEKYQTQNRGMFPIWHGVKGDDAMASSVSGVKAVAAGLRNRPVKETIRDLLQWWATLPEDRTATMRAGMTPENEAQLITAWKAREA